MGEIDRKRYFNIIQLIRRTAQKQRQGEQSKRTLNARHQCVMKNENFKKNA